MVAVAVRSNIPRAPGFWIPAFGEYDAGGGRGASLNANHCAANNPSTRATVLTEPHTCATYCSAMRCSDSL